MEDVEKKSIKFKDEQDTKFKTKLNEYIQKNKIIKEEIKRQNKKLKEYQKEIRKYQKEIEIFKSAQNNMIARITVYQKDIEDYATEVKTLQNLLSEKEIEKLKNNEQKVKDNVVIFNLKL